MDIKSGRTYPSKALSNFAPHPFKFDGVLCNSMEGLLQSFKFKNPDMQVEICKLIGLAALRKGRTKNWKVRQILYWQGVEYKRTGLGYQQLLDNAYDALALNTAFRKALLASGESTLTHSIGKRKESDTVLTQKEFCSRLLRIRKELNNETI